MLEFNKKEEERSPAAPEDLYQTKLNVVNYNLRFFRVVHDFDFFRGNRFVVDANIVQ